MKTLIKQLKSITAGRYHIITTNTPEGLQLDCLDLACKLIESRTFSTTQVQNSVLLTAAFADLRGRLNC